MKKLILIFILLFPHRGLGGFLYAQGDFTRIYHPIINEAELAIVDTNYYEALDFYKEAFANVKKPFAKDYYNAAICAAMTGKLSLTFDYLEKIVEKGYPSDSLRKDVFFHYVADTCKRWGDFEKQMRLVKPNINWEVRDSLKKLYALSTNEVYTPLSPELRKYYKEKYSPKIDTIAGKPIVISRIRMPYDSLIFDLSMPKELRLQYDSLKVINDKFYSKNNEVALNKTLTIIENEGFIDENIIGLSGYDIQFKNAYGVSIINNNWIFNNNVTTNILISRDFNVSILKILIKAIRDGKISPHKINHYSSQKFNPITKTLESPLPLFYTLGNVKVLQLQLESNLVCESLRGIENKKFWKKEKFAEYSEAEINEKRQDIGLEKLADAYKKAFFKANPTPFIINGGSYQKELSYISSCEVLEKMLKESIIAR